MAALGTTIRGGAEVVRADGAEAAPAACAPAKESRNAKHGQNRRNCGDAPMRSGDEVLAVRRAGKVRLDAHAVTESAQIESPPRETVMKVASVQWLWVGRLPAASLAKPPDLVSSTF